MRNGAVSKYPHFSQLYILFSPFERMKLTHPKHYQFCIGGGAFDTDGLWKPTKDGLGYARVLDYIGVKY